MYYIKFNGMRVYNFLLKKKKFLGCFQISQSIMIFFFLKSF